MLIFKFLLEKKGNRKYLSIGKLIAQESDLSSLIFSISNKKKRRAKVSQTITWIRWGKRNLSIRLNQTSNAIGDQAKIGWLKQAMTKVVAPTDKPNGKAVNEKLGQFIFDSSKARRSF